MVEVMPVMTLKMCTTGRQINGTRALCLDALVEMLRWLEPRTEREPRGCLRSQVLWRSCIITTVSFTLLCTGNVHDLKFPSPRGVIYRTFLQSPLPLCSQTSIFVTTFDSPGAYSWSHHLTKPCGEKIAIPELATKNLVIFIQDWSLWNLLFVSWDPDTSFDIRTGLYPKSRDNKLTHYFERKLSVFILFYSL